MKKIMFVLTAIALAVGVRAAQVDWKVAGDASMDGYSVYVLLGDTAKTDWANANEVSAAALNGGSGTMEKNGRNYAVMGTVNDDAIVKGTAASLYYVIVNGDTFATIAPADYTASIYDVSAGDSPVVATSVPGTNLNYKSFEGVGPGPGPTPVDTPEPTSGLLLLVGGAALALRRKLK